MICLAVTYVMKPGAEDEAIRRLHALTGASRAEPGCRLYQAHRSTTDPRTFFLYEQYDDQAALESHRSTPHFLEHVVGGLMELAESRAPALYEPLPD